jgi:Ca-activated chloride channel family protein
VENLKRAAAAGDGATVTVTPDGRDVEKLAGIVETLFTAAKGEQGSERWRDLGYWLLPVIALLTVPWFRRGWVVGYD